MAGYSSSWTTRAVAAPHRLPLRILFMECLPRVLRPIAQAKLECQREHTQIHLDNSKIKVMNGNTLPGCRILNMFIITAFMPVGRSEYGNAASLLETFAANQESGKSWRIFG
jgi:hypothetical protein